MHPTRLAIFAALSVSVSVWACASGSPAPDPAANKDGNSAKPGQPGKGSGANPSGSPQGAGAPASSGAPAAGAGADDDAAEGKIDACEAACDRAHPAGAAKSKQIDDQAMACTCAPTACGAQCANTDVCKKGGTELADGDPCAKCLEGAAADKCSAGEDQCQADADCKAVVECYDKCDPETAADKK